MAEIHPYFRANALLNSVFFNGRFAGQPVYLSLDNEMRSALADELDCPCDTVEERLCNHAASYLSRDHTPYARLETDMRLWRRRGMHEPPPCTAMLFCLAHAAAIMAADGEFAANNYYRRLSQLTGLSNESLSSSRAATGLFWNGLADWLLLHNYALGRPTARPTNAWRFVGRAMSQAIVRASDRHHFHDLFEKFGFSGSEDISARDMEYFLSYWMETSGATPRLKRVWRDPTLRERVAEAAIAELHAWNMQEVRHDRSESSQPIRLSLLANLIPSFPRPVLELHLGRLGEFGQRGPFTFEGTSSNFFLTNDLFGNVATLLPNPFGESERQISTVVQLAPKAAGAERKMAWEPRLIIPFAIHPRANIWMEVGRVSFAAPHMLLVRNANSLPQQVDRYLANACVTLPAKAADGLNGLPSGWVLYQDVRVSRIVEPPRKDLECLVPLGDDGSLSIDGGLQLLPGFFHAKLPPAVTYFAGTGPTNIEVAANVDESLILCGATSDTADCRLELGEVARANHGLVVRGWRGTDTVVTRELFFRSADRPHPLHQDGKGRLVYSNMISAGQTSPNPEIYVEGFSAMGRLLPSPPAGLVLSSNPVIQGAVEDFQEARLSTPLSMRLSSRKCLDRGYHVTVFPTLDPKTSAGKPIEGTCSDCKRRDVVIFRGGRRVAGNKPVNLPGVNLLPISVPTESAPKEIDADLLLDALSFVGQGSWARLQSLLETWGNGGRHPRQVAHDLFLLGYLDLKLRPGSNSVKAWCVPPPTINFISRRRAFVAGFRSQSLIESIKRRCEKAGGQFSSSVTSGRPTSYWLEDVPEDRACEAFADVRDPLGRVVTVNKEVGVSIARACRTFNGIEDFLRPVSLGRAPNLQRFDLLTARWSDLPVAVGEGAYRWNDGLPGYAYLNATGEAVSGPYQIIKLLAARSAGIQLHHYDPENKIFSSTLGCEPPGLLERSLVACTGTLPMLGRGTATYTNVPSSVATTILTILYAEGRSEYEERKSNQRC